MLGDPHVRAAEAVFVWLCKHVGGEVTLPSECIGKGAFVRERKGSPCLEYAAFVEWRKGRGYEVGSSVRCVPFHPNKGGKFCNGLRGITTGGWCAGPGNLCLELLFFEATGMWLL